MIYYKVCLYDHYINKYYSTVSEHKYIREYKIGEWVYPTIGKLFIFNNIVNAERFTKSQWHKQLCIFKCEALNPKECERIVITSYFELEENIRRFWNNIAVDISSPPNGSLMCDAIKLLELVNYE